MAVTVKNWLGDYLEVRVIPYRMLNYNLETIISIQRVSFKYENIMVVYDPYLEDRGRLGDWNVLIVLLFCRCEIVGFLHTKPTMSEQRLACYSCGLSISAKAIATKVMLEERNF